MNAEAREREILGQWAGDLRLTQVEHRAAVVDLLWATLNGFVHSDRLLEAAPHVEELDAEAAILVGPQRLVATEADGLVLIVREVDEVSRRELRRRRIGPRRERSRMTFERSEIESLCRRRRCG
jgi:hypothetical protein